MKTKIYFTYPITISWAIYKNLDEKYQNIGWVYNPYGRCWTHHFHKSKERVKFIKYINRRFSIL